MMNVGYEMKLPRAESDECGLWDEATTSRE